MSRESKKRIDTSPEQAPLAGLESVFSGLESLTLPPGPPTSAASPPPSQGIWKLGRVILRRETAHRGGKTVVVVHDFATHLPISVIENMARKLRSACGCGGMVRGRTIEIQGDQPGKIREFLEREGFQVAGVK